jgi:hypothetical protein
MLIAGITMTALVCFGALVLRRLHPSPSAANRLVGASLVTVVLASTVVFAAGITANAAIVPTIQLGTASNYAVLAASTVTNTGNTVLNGSLGLSPGSSITGFPPGVVVPPSTIDATNAAALQAQSDLTAAYVNAAGRPLDATTPADLTDLVLVGGVYAGPAPGKPALELTGPLVLDGEGDPDSVFIFQTDSTLITGTGSTVSLINGAQACNVFWQVGSSATLGEDSVFVGNILALTSVSVGSNVVVDGRALARNGAVTLINDVFTAPGCTQAPPTTTTTLGGATSTTAGGVTTTLPGTTTTLGGTTSTTAGGVTTTLPGTPTTVGGPTTTLQGTPTTLEAGTLPGTPTTVGGTATTLPGTPTTLGEATTTAESGRTTTTMPGTATTTASPGTPYGPSDSTSRNLPRTGSDIWVLVLLAILAMIIGAAALGARRTASRP